MVQENVANAVNSIVKYFCRPESAGEVSNWVNMEKACEHNSYLLRDNRCPLCIFLQRGNLTYLLCGENGLCDSLDQVRPDTIIAVICVVIFLCS